MHNTNPSLIQELKKQCNQLETAVLHHYKNRSKDTRHRKLALDYAMDLEAKRNLLTFIMKG